MRLRHYGLRLIWSAALLALLAAGRPGRLDWPHGVAVEVTARAVIIRRGAGLRA